MGLIPSGNGFIIKLTKDPCATQYPAGSVEKTRRNDYANQTIVVLHRGGDIEHLDLVRITKFSRKNNKN